MNTKRTSSFEKSLSEKYTHIPGCQKSGAFHIRIKKNRVSDILFGNWGLIVYLAALKKGDGGGGVGGYSARTSLLCHT